MVHQAARITDLQRLAKRFVRLPVVLDWEYEGADGRRHALIHAKKGASPAVGLDVNGAEYLIDVELIRRKDGGAELVQDGVVTHVRDKSGKWESLVGGAPPTAFHDVTFAMVSERHGPQAKATLASWLRAASEFSDGKRAKPPSWLLLTGVTGSGKTSVAKLLHRELLAAGVPCVFVRWTDVVESFRLARQNRQADPSTTAHPVLLVDDIGADNRSPMAAEVLFKLTDDAEQNGQLLATTSNYRPSDLASRYDAGGADNAERGVDRLTRRGRVVVLSGG